MRLSARFLGIAPSCLRLWRGDITPQMPIGAKWFRGFASSSRWRTVFAPAPADLRMEGYALSIQKHSLTHYADNIAADEMAHIAAMSGGTLAAVSALSLA